jgi:hypothetical protein
VRLETHRPTQKSDPYDASSCADDLGAASIAPLRKGGGLVCTSRVAGPTWALRPSGQALSGGRSYGCKLHRQDSDPDVVARKRERPAQRAFASSIGECRPYASPGSPTALRGGVKRRAKSFVHRPFFVFQMAEVGVALKLFCPMARVRQILTRPHLSDREGRTNPEPPQPHQRGDGGRERVHGVSRRP